MKKEKDPEIKTVSRNRRAHQKFSVLETLEAGISLFGHEVKSLRQGKADIEESMVRFERGEAFLFNAHIPPYSHLSHVEYQPTRTRKLLLHRNQIEKLSGQAQAKGLAVIPLELYFKHGIAKVTIALAKGKKHEDRREEIKKREADRDMRRAKG